MLINNFKTTHMSKDNENSDKDNKQPVILALDFLFF